MNRAAVLPALPWFGPPAWSVGLLVPAVLLAVWSLSAQLGWLPPHWWSAHGGAPAGGGPPPSAPRREPSSPTTRP